MTIFLATLGQRPEAITMALDALLPHYLYDEVVILHTDRQRSGIKEAFKVLDRELRTFPRYRGIQIRSSELCHEAGSPIIDITDHLNAESYFRSVLSVLKFHREQGIPMHLLVAGGRKAMSVYATLAASVIFGENDCVWTVLSSPQLIEDGFFHVPEGRETEVQVFNLPILPSRFLPGVLQGKSLDEVLQIQISPRIRFLQTLTPKERQLADILSEQPRAKNDQLAARLGKKVSTIENQLTSIYSKLHVYYELDEDAYRKRQTLLDVLAGRI